MSGEAAKPPQAEQGRFAAGVILRFAKCPVAPVAIGMASGTTSEGKSRQGMISAQGDFMEFVSGPIALGMLGLSVAFVAGPFIGSRRSGEKSG